MADIPQLLTALHVFANVVWVGAIAAVGWVLGAQAATPEVRGDLALRLYRGLATPAFLASFVFGTARLSLALPFYFVQTKFMHGKLFFALAVIALHHVIGAMARRQARGQSPASRQPLVMVALLLLSAGVTVFFAVLKPF